ncbi:hypothetical protein k02a2.6-like [Plakobranchus ocellatus]|uniref:WH1 domain-containing protein n=1 Tax=Plakobranchus ocellatus TaxID=259542 RepID=A0AAV4ASH7_9GAST|nr:hypothetical protein k02a2.6-like [Plakobranchus ocellatus]
MIRRANSWRELGASGKISPAPGGIDAGRCGTPLSSFGVPLLNTEKPMVYAPGSESPGPSSPRNRDLGFNPLLPYNIGLAGEIGECAAAAEEIPNSNGAKANLSDSKRQGTNLRAFPIISVSSHCTDALRQAGVHKMRKLLETHPALDQQPPADTRARALECREQPIFTTKAHVFQIDAGTKKEWVPASKSSVSVSYYFDSTRNTYRIISVDGSKAIVNSTITPNMTFTKTSQKFGQWSDPRANTVYGLGFSSEQDLTKFVEKFKEIKELTRQAVQLRQQQLQQLQQQQQQAELNGEAGQAQHHSLANVSSSPQPVRHHHQLHQRTNSLSSIQNDSSSLRERRNSFTQGGSNGLPANASSEAQLKYENDRLKLALAQSSANAKKWEVELQTLKNNNARLTAALQESTTNVEEWKKQLAAYKDESVRLKKKLLDQDKGGGGANSNDPLMVAQLTDQVEKIRLDNQNKQEDIKRLNNQIQDLTQREGQIASLQERVQALEEDNHSLSLQLQDAQRQLAETRGSRDRDNRELLALQEALGAKIAELYETHETAVSLLRKESQS